MPLLIPKVPWSFDVTCFYLPGAWLSQIKAVSNIRHSKVEGLAQGHEFLLCQTKGIATYFILVSQKEMFFPLKIQEGRDLMKGRSFELSAGHENPSPRGLIFLFLTLTPGNFSQAVRQSPDQCVGTSVICISNHIHPRTHNSLLCLAPWKNSVHFSCRIRVNCDNMSRRNHLSRLLVRNSTDHSNNALH